jgi:hypothetical protein
MLKVDRVLKNDLSPSLIQWLGEISRAFYHATLDLPKVL